MYLLEQEGVGISPSMMEPCVYRMREEAEEKLLGKKLRRSSLGSADMVGRVPHGSNLWGSSLPVC